MRLSPTHQHDTIHTKQPAVQVTIFVPAFPVEPLGHAFGLPPVPGRPPPADARRPGGALKRRGLPAAAPARPCPPSRSHPSPRAIPMRSQRGPIHRVYCSLYGLFGDTAHVKKPRAVHVMSPRKYNTLPRLQPVPAIHLPNTCSTGRTHTRKQCLSRHTATCKIARARRRRTTQ